MRNVTSGKYKENGSKLQSSLTVVVLLDSNHVFFFGVSKKNICCQVVQNCDELFEREQLSAAPDVGWPDCFNSGVFVFTPSADTFSQLITFAQERGSFDGKNYIQFYILS